MSTAPALPADAPDAFADALAATVTPASCLDAARRAVVRSATLAPSVAARALGFLAPPARAPASPAGSRR